MKVKNTSNTDLHNVKAVIFGGSGRGKTTLAGTLKEKTLIISAESGLLSLQDKSIDFVDMNDYDNKLQGLGDIYATLRKGSDYKNIFIDSITEISELILEQANKEFPDRKHALVMFGEVKKKLKGIIKGFRDLQGYNVFITALEKVEKDEVGRRYKTPDLVGSMSQSIAQFFDEVFYYEMLETEDGEVKRALLTQPNANIVAKDRSGRLDKYEKPDLEQIMNKIFKKGEK